jgi:hypothetical protein
VSTDAGAPRVHVVRTGASLDDVPGDDLVVVADDAWLVAGVDGVAAAFAAEALVAPAVLRSPDGRVVVGRAADVRAGAPQRVSRRLHTHREGVTETIVMNGELIDVAAGVPVAVVVDASPGIRAAVASGVGRDLAQLLRYDGGVDPARWYRVVADEIVEVPFWTPEFCATVVRAAEAVGVWTPDEHDPVPGNEVSLATISPRLFAHVEDHLAAHVMPLLNEVWPVAEFAGVQDAFVIKYVPGATSGLRLHHDVAQISASVRLVDGYEGGVLEFPRQGFANSSVPVGHLLAWPSLVTHPHVAAAVTDGVKYGLTVWFAIPGQD